MRFRSGSGRGPELAASQWRDSLSPRRVVLVLRRCRTVRTLVARLKEEYRVKKLALREAGTSKWTLMLAREGGSTPADFRVTSGSGHKPLISSWSAEFAIDVSAPSTAAGCTPDA